MVKAFVGNSNATEGKWQPPSTTTDPFLDPFTGKPILRSDVRVVNSTSEPLPFTFVSDINTQTQTFAGVASAGFSFVKAGYFLNQFVIVITSGHTLSSFYTTFLDGSLNITYATTSTTLAYTSGATRVYVVNLPYNKLANTYAVQGSGTFSGNATGYFAGTFSLI
jgi:hypothetical protein